MVDKVVAWHSLGSEFKPTSGWEKFIAVIDIALGVICFLICFTYRPKLVWSEVCFTYNCEFHTYRVHVGSWITIRWIGSGPYVFPLYRVYWVITKLRFHQLWFLPFPPQIIGESSRPMFALSFYVGGVMHHIHFIHPYMWSANAAVRHSHMPFLVKWFF